MHVAYLVEHAPPEIGAAPARVEEMGRRWLQRGAEVTVLTAMPHRPEGRIHRPFRGRFLMEEDRDGLRVMRSWVFARPRGGTASTLLNNLSFACTSLLQAFRVSPAPDVLIASAPPFFAHLPGVVTARLRGIPLVLELRDLWPDYIEAMGVIRSPLLLRALFGLEKMLLARADHVVVVTESFRERVASKGVPRDRISVIPNGVDTEFYRPADTAGAETGATLGSSVARLRIGYLGNFGAGQGLEAVVQAAAILEARGVPVELVLVGGGREEESLREAASEKRLSNLEIRPPIAKAETPDFYRSCDACLVPLAPVDVFQETVPSKIFEVMASARPVIGSLAGEGRTVIEKSGGGLVTPPGDAAGIAESIEELHRLSAEERMRMGRRGREYVERHYRRDRLADRYLDLLGVVRENEG